jgi:DNA-binding transcriptional regulator YiaG
MNPHEIAQLRTDLGLSQVQFAQLFGMHFMTVSKWEKGVLTPNDYQQALLDQFRKTADQKKAQMKEQLGKLLIGAGVIAALVLLLTGR